MTSGGTRHRWRSILAAPGDNWKLLKKQASQPCDLVMIDLEHAVHPHQKGMALDLTLRALCDLDYGSKEVVVRVNGFDTPWFSGEIAALSERQPHHYVVPKVSDAAGANETLERMTEIERQAGARRTPPVWFQIERAAAVLQAEWIAALPRVKALMMGNVDLEAEVGFEVSPTGSNPVLEFAKSRVLLACAKAGLEAFEGAITEIRHEARVTAAVRASLGLGFNGAILVSPRQFGPARLGTVPSEARIVEARRIVEVFAEAWRQGFAVTQVDGAFVDDVVAERSLRVLQRAGHGHCERLAVWRDEGA